MQKRRLWFPISLGLATIALAVLALGTWRYDGVQGLYLRVRAEFAAPEAVAMAPTPLPTSTAAATMTLVPPTVTPAPSGTPVPSSTPASTGTPAATATPAPTETPTPTPEPLYVAAVPRVELSGMRHEWQTWNNCGPASLATQMSFFGSTLGQAQVAAVVHPDKDDKHVGIPQLEMFAQAQGWRTWSRVNGDADMLKLLVSNGFPVLVPTWHVDAKDTGMGHYRVVTGYDDAIQEWIVYDSLESRGISRDAPYAGVRLSYEQFEIWWQVQNRAFLVVFPAEKAPVVEQILGERLNDALMWETSLAFAREKVAERPEDAFAWFTLGTNLAGNGLMAEAAEAYDHARQIGLPGRMFWYQHEPFRVYLEVGRLDEVVALADATIAATTMIEELHYWRGRALAGLGDIEGARAALQTALTQRPAYPEVVEALAALDQ